MHLSSPPLEAHCLVDPYSASSADLIPPVILMLGDKPGAPAARLSIIAPGNQWCTIWFILSAPLETTLLSKQMQLWYPHSAFWQHLYVHGSTKGLHIIKQETMHNWSASLLYNKHSRGSKAVYGQGLSLDSVNICYYISQTGNVTSEDN